MSFWLLLLLKIHNSKHSVNFLEKKKMKKRRYRTRKKRSRRHVRARCWFTHKISSPFSSSFTKNDFGIKFVYVFSYKCLFSFILSLSLSLARLAQCHVTIAMPGYKQLTRKKNSFFYNWWCDEMNDFLFSLIFKLKTRTRR